MRPAGKLIAIIGGGLAGNLLAIHLARRGAKPVVIERQSSYAGTKPERGRSINLALAARGIAALERCGVRPRIEPLLIPMHGRMIHEPGVPPRLAPYGQRDNEIIYSVSRSALNRTLFAVASEDFGIEYRFGSICHGIEAGTQLPIVETNGEARTIEADIVLACDGAGSAIRESLRAAEVLSCTEERLDHAYKELGIAPGADGDFRLEPHALHIWPRGNHMLIALPNTDSSFTATLFLPLEGEPSFASLDPADIEAFFAAEFPDAAPLIEDPATQYRINPTGLLGTVRCAPWTDRQRYLLLGDAAHAVVPFHGQGMNAAFEDVTELDRLLDAHGDDWNRVFTAFENARIPNANAIADMAVENYLEMRDTVRDPVFELRRRLAFELERRFQGRFIPRYSMVMFHPEISYAEAQRRGAAQERILIELTEEAASIDDVDFGRAESLIATALDGHAGRGEFTAV